MLASVKGRREFMSDETPLYRPPQSGDKARDTGPPLESIDIGGFGHTPSDNAPWPVPTRRKSRRAVVAASVAGVGLLAAGGFTAVALLSGGGPQPDEVLPGSALAYVRLDFDPSAGQKIEALDLVDKLPEGIRDDDLRRTAWNLLAADDAELSAIDFDTEIEPWAGDRMGLAVLPGADAVAEPVIVLAVQVKDEQKARDGIDLLAGDNGTGVAFENGYALIAQTQAEADYAAAAADNLADRSDYQAAMERIGEQGVASAWVDLAAVEALVMEAAAASGAELPAEVGGFGDELAFAVRFADGRIELEGEVTGVESTQTLTASNAGYSVADLPASTAFAAQVDGLGAALGQAWPQLAGLIPVQELSDSLGITLPDDAAAVLGERFIVALDSRLDAAGGPLAGAVSISDDAQRAQEIVTRVLTAEAPDLPFSVEADVNHLYVALGYEAAELRGGGGLGDVAEFADVVANPDGPFVLYANVDQLAALATGDEEPVPALVEAMTAVGASVHQDGSTTRFSVRVSLD